MPFILYVIFLILSHVQQNQRNKDHSHCGTLTRNQPFLEGHNADQRNHDDRTDAERRIGDDSRNACQRQQKKTGAEIIGNADQHAENSVPARYALFFDYAERRRIHKRTDSDS